MNNNEFLTIQEFIQKYEVPDIRIRRRIRKYRLIEPQKLEGVLSERYDKGVGNVILLKEDFWVKELEAVAKDTAYAVPTKRSDEATKRYEEPLSRSEEIEPNRLSDTAYAVPIKQSEEVTQQSDEVKPSSSSDAANTSEQITIDREFLAVSYTHLTLPTKRIV